jgi:hypothetical protein
MSLCDSSRQLLATGSISLEYEEIGRKLIPNALTFPISFIDSEEGYVRFGATYDVFLYLAPPVLFDHADFRLELDFSSDGNGYFETNTTPLQPFPSLGVCDFHTSYSGPIAGSVLRRSSTNSLFPPIETIPLSSGCEIPTCEVPNACEWFLHGRAPNATNWSYCPGGTCDQCGFANLFAPASQSGRYAVRMDRFYFWTGSLTMPNTSGNLSLGNFTTEWVGI